MNIKDSTELKEFIIKTLEDNKAEDIICFDIGQKTAMAKYMIFASGRSTRNVSAIATNLTSDLKKIIRMKTNIEGAREGEWALVDAGDVIVNIFHPEARNRFKLEERWG